VLACVVHGIIARWAFVWSGVAWVAVGLGYAGLGPGIFGKRADGSLPLFNALFTLPFLLFAWLSWLVQTSLSGENIADEIVPGLWLARRCAKRNLPPSVRSIVDVTAEFPVDCAIRRDLSYACFPVLDTIAPPIATLEEIVSYIASVEESLLVHCALGHGRSALVVAAVLIDRHIVDTPDEAVQFVKARRPAIHLNRPQRRCLTEWYASRAHTMGKTRL
jgi:protein-tyrosine phosphatase